MSAIANYLSFLNSAGSGQEPEVHVAHRNYDQTLTLTTGAGRVSLGVSAAEKVWVKSVDGKDCPKGEGRFVHRSTNSRHEFVLSS